MSESGTKRTCRDEAPMSAFRGKADIRHDDLTIAIYEYTP
jgi:hypothetical protein